MMLRQSLVAASFALLLALLGASGRSIALAQEDVPDCNVHPLDTEATAAARIARCAQLAPAALTAIDKVAPVIEPPELMAKRKANNAAAAAAAAALAGAGMGGGGASGAGAVPGPAA